MTVRTASPPHLRVSPEPSSMVQHLEIPLRGWLEPIAGAGISVLAFSMTTEEVAVGISLLTAAVLVIIWLVRVEAQGRENAKALARLEKRLNALVEHLGGLPG